MEQTAVTTDVNNYCMLAEEQMKQYTGLRRSFQRPASKRIDVARHQMIRKTKPSLQNTCTILSERTQVAIKAN